MQSTKKNITASIVVYKEKTNELQKAINSFLNSPHAKKLYIIDNSPTNKIEKHISHKKPIEYIFTGKNMGFGKGHNLVIDKIKNNSDYHLILNPDVSFNPSIFDSLLEVLDSNPEVAMIAPKVLFPDRSFQNSCRRFPTIKELIGRSLPMLSPLFKSRIEKGKYKDVDLSVPLFADYLTGCFHLYKTDDFIKINGFDERYFLYMEDVDICKKIDQAGKKKMYYPKEEIVHVLKKGSSKKIHLFFRHVISAIKYFNKWGGLNALFNNVLI